MKETCFRGKSPDFLKSIKKTGFQGKIGRFLGFIKKTGFGEKRLIYWNYKENMLPEGNRQVFEFIKKPGFGEIGWF